MSGFLSPILARWRLTALVASLGMLAIAHGFETLGGLAPCTLCLRAREVYWVAAAVALAGYLAIRISGGERFKALFNAALALIFLFGFGLAVYHAGAEWKFWPGPAACASGGLGGGVSASDLSALLNGAKIKPPACDEPAWVFLGLSMAGWNGLVSLGLAILSAMAALQERKAK
jgi:disulfide bond formation protein DsbB